MKFNHCLLLMIKKINKNNLKKKIKNKITNNLVKIYQIYYKKWILKKKNKRMSMIKY